MQVRDLPETAEQTLQRVREENTILKTYLRDLIPRGWEIWQLVSSRGFVARYGVNGHPLYSHLTVTNNFYSIAVEGRLIARREDGSVDIIHNKPMVCDDLPSAVEHIEAERIRLEDEVNREYAATKSPISRVA